MMMVVQLSNYRNQCIVHLKWINYMIFKICLNKVKEKKNL